MLERIVLLAHLLLAVSRAQQIGTLIPEVHPSLTWQKCTTAGGCTTVLAGGVVLDANSRWIHNVGGSTNCFTGNTWNAELCPDDVTCAANCALDGASYSSSGVTTSGNAITLQPSASTVGDGNPRVYLIASNNTYQTFKVLNQEFTFDVNLSELGCGYNGALYLSQMDADGGMSKYPTNKAGAQYGTGYCDSQCPRDLKFINGQGNIQGWEPSATNSRDGTGEYGSCCDEMDLWEANAISSVFAAHTCSVNGQTRCAGTQCGSSTSKYSGLCDPDGCDFNPYRLGDTSFYGQGMIVDTSKTFTVITQFITSNNTPAGNLTEIRRLYVQNGKVIQNPPSAIAGITPYNSISDNFCVAQKTAFGDTDSFEMHGGMTAMGKSLSAGMVLVMSLTYDYANTLWLDSDYPSNSTARGATRGTCPPTTPPTLPISPQPPHSVIFSNIRFGDIGSTYSTKVSGTTTSTPPKSTSSTASSTASAAGATQTKYGQCGGIGYLGPTVCSGSTCTYSNPYFSQCL